MEKPTYEQLLESLTWIVVFCMEHMEWFEEDSGAAEMEWLADAEKLVREAQSKT